MCLQKYYRNICVCKNIKRIYALAKILKEYMRLQKYKRNICASKNIKRIYALAKILKYICACKNIKGIYALAKNIEWKYMHLQKYQRNICACKSIEAQDFFCCNIASFVLAKYKRTTLCWRRKNVISLSMQKIDGEAQLTLLSA